MGEGVRHLEKGHDIAYYGDPRFVGWGVDIAMGKWPGGGCSGREGSLIERRLYPGQSGRGSGLRLARIASFGLRFRSLIQKE
jgi:hypothetical protein